jgi:ABC-type molybdate transport system substrate-binding protein
MLGVHSNRAVISMGDKSPKAKEKSKKQDTADKNQKKAAAGAKAAVPSGGNAKKK